MTQHAQLTLDFEHRPALSGADFLVAPCNAEAVSWLDRWPEWPGPALVIFGPPGCGKTHLTRVFMARSGAREVSLGDLAAIEPPVLLGDHPACVVDDADAVLAVGLEEALLHLYNTAREGGQHLLVTARTPPAHWNLGLRDLSSRLNAAPAVGIDMPDDALVSAVLVKLFADRQLKPDAEVIPFLAARMERSFAAAGHWVEAIDKAALSEHRNITVPFVRQVMAEDRSD